MTKLAIFDLDGTLLDTRRAMARCGNAALTACGLKTFPWEDYAAFSGGGVEDFVAGILRAGGDETAEHFDFFWKTYLAEQEKHPLLGNAPFPGMPELLSEMKGRGLALAALSNKDHASCVELLEQNFGGALFDLILGDDGTYPPKPDPAGALAILRHFGLQKEEALYVGDTQADMLTGKNTGIPTAAALWGYRSREILAPFAPAYFAETPRDLLKWI